MPVYRARIAIAGEEASGEVAQADVGVRLELSLTAGCTHLQTWFETEDGDELGAYYVYVEWLGP